MKYLRYYLIGIFFLGWTSIFAQDQTGYVFVVKIAPSWNGLVTYYEAFYDGRRFSEVKNLSKRQFVLRAAGVEQSTANAEKRNLWDEFDIFYFGNKRVDKDKEAMMHPDFFPNPPIVDSLWKLRFAVYPYKTDSKDTLGWTMNFQNIYVPTHRQKIILAQMGMDTVFYTIFGNNLFRLLKAMQDPQWVQNYKNAQDDTQTSAGEN